MTTALDVQAMQVMFGAHAGLRDITLQVQAGDCLAILGASGSGKSSLLRTLAGLQDAAGGRVLVHGRDVSALPPERRSVVYLHQEPVLFPHRTVLKNVLFPLQMRGVAAAEARRQALEWLTTLQVAAVADRMPSTLSGGQRHRVALARALCAAPAVLLLDEPLASLDPAIRRDVRDALLAARAASGAAMVLVTHDLDDALAIATQLMTLEDGRQTPPASPSALLASPSSLATARLLGVYAELQGEVIATANGRQFRWIGGGLAASGIGTGPAVACVRSHEIEVHRQGDLDAPRLTVVEQRQGAHEILLGVRDDHGETALLRVSGATTVAVGDTVQVTMACARFFPLA